MLTFRTDTIVPALECVSMGTERVDTVIKLAKRVKLLTPVEQFIISNCKPVKQIDVRLVNSVVYM